jgi:hypothetical protein
VATEEEDVEIPFLADRAWPSHVLLDRLPGRFLIEKEFAFHPPKSIALLAAKLLIGAAPVCDTAFNLPMSAYLSIPTDTT